ncbi:MAG: sulfur globule protein [Gammaproteobacteria bacterium]|nr:sulfur globule protein [Gammaproteobacteria bacterium]
MKRLVVASIFSVFLLGLMSNASAFWGSNKSYECYGPYGKIPGCNEYDEWDPRYWMEEMSDMWDDDDDYYGGGRGYGMPYGGGYGAPMPYGGGYGAPMPYGGGYGAPAPMPYGYPQPYAAPAPAPAPAQ